MNYVSEPKTIFIYSWSTIWSMKNKSGAPSFFRTIDLYIKKGWDVNLILTDAHNGANEIADNCHVYVMKKWKTDKWISAKMRSKPFLLLKMFRYYSYAKEITKHIMRQKDVQSTLFYGYEVHGVPAAEWASKKYKRPLVTRFQGTVATYFKDNLATKIKQYFRLKALKTEADLVIMTDDGTQGLTTLKRLGNPSKNIVFWKNGLDLFEKEYSFSETDRKIMREALGILEGECMLLTVSRLQDWKRVDRAICALAEVVNRDNPGFKLVIVGDGPARSTLEELATQKNVGDKVVFVGAQEHDRVYDFMSCADIFLSLYDMSNVGNPLLEALTLGKCIVTLTGGDTDKVIQNDYNGVIIEPEDIGKLPEIILNLSQDSSQKQKLEEGAKDYAMKNLYSWSTRMEMEYKKVLELME